MAPGQIQPVQIPQSQKPVQIPDIPESVQIPDVPEPVQILDVPAPPVQIPDVPQPFVQIPDVPQPLVQIPDVPQSLVQIPDVPQPPVQIPPELNTLKPTDALDQLMSFGFGLSDQELQLLPTVPSIFDGDLISFLDEFERELAMEPMDLTMPRLKPCVKNLLDLKSFNPCNNLPENKSHFFVRRVSVQHLLDQCRHRTTIVFGNLGRWRIESRITSQSILTPSFLNPTLACTFLFRLEKQSSCLRVIWI
ncbi:hypothetical protein TNCV_4313971 [Trichonephila clavipes]|nr:hypothetical protein TNCV_4313971 [Trichonephila clavipes]